VIVTPHKKARARLKVNCNRHIQSGVALRCVGRCTQGNLKKLSVVAGLFYAARCKTVDEQNYMTPGDKVIGQPCAALTRRR
jgi:hypothetical protein